MWLIAHWHWIWFLIVPFAVLAIVSWVHDMGVAMEPYELRRQIATERLRQELADLKENRK